MHMVRLENPAYFMSTILRENNVFKADKVEYAVIEYCTDYHNFDTAVIEDTVCYMVDDFICCETKETYVDKTDMEPWEDHEPYPRERIKTRDIVVMIPKSHIIKIKNPSPVNIANVRNYGM